MGAAAGAAAQEAVELRAESDGDNVLVRAFQGDTAQAAPLLQATWRMADGNAPAFDLQRPVAPGGDAHLSLDQLLLAAIEQYLDRRVHFAKQGVHTDLPVERMAAEIDGMIAQAAATFNAPGLGLSEPTRRQLTRVSRIDWSQARFGVDGGDDQDKYLAIYYYVRTQRQELERQLRADLLPLAAVDVLVPAGGARPNPGRTVEVPTVCRTVFDDQNYLCALDLTVGDTQPVPDDGRLTDQLMANLAAKARVEEARSPEPKLRKRDRWLKAELDAINERIDKMDQRKELWALRDRMDGMEERIDALDARVDGLGTDGSAAVPDKPAGHLLTVRFAKGSTQVDAGSRAMLNEVFEQLARSPQDRVLITGFTDSSGDPAANLALSEARAQAVRSYLLERGIAGERLLVNYYGDRRSNGADPSERRVEIERLR